MKQKKKITIRKVLVVGAVILFVMLLSACGNEQTVADSSDKVENSESSEQVAQQIKEDEEKDKSQASAAVETYLNNLYRKQSSIRNISWINIPDISGNYYYFSCTVEYTGLKREGIVTVKKNSDGTFKATGLEFND